MMHTNPENENWMAEDEGWFIGSKEITNLYGIEI